MKTALVLGGGGSKGSYQMGVWQALEELNFKFDIVTGTSIGALNGLMYVENDYEGCLKLWKTMSNDKIMKNPILLEDLNIKKTLKSMNDLVPFIRSYIQKKGVDISPFIEMLDHYTDYNKIKDSNIDFHVMTVQFPQFKPEPLHINELDIEHISKAILASASCFPLFPVCKFKDKSLIDGGYYDNLPIDLAFENGATNVVAVDLNYSITHLDYLNRPNIDYIHPSWSLGGFFYFESDMINNNIILGYNDTMKHFGKYEGFRYTFYRENISDKLLNHAYLQLMYYDRMYRKANQKSLVKIEDENDILKIINKHTYSKLSLKDYYIRLIEVVLEFFKINHLTVYTFDKIKSIIVDKVYNVEIENTEILAKYNKLKSNKTKREYLVSLNKFDLLGTFLSVEDKDESLLLDILLSRPKIIIIHILLSIWRQENDSKDK